MTKSVYKVLSVITALCLFITMCPISANASSQELHHTESVSVIQFSPDTELKTENSVKTNRFYGLARQVDTSKYFYNQLTNNQKQIYDQLWTAGPIQSITLDLSNITITGKGTSSSSKTNAESAAMNDVVMAITALNEDNPLFFWVSGFSISYGGTRKSSGGSYVYAITALIVNIDIDTSDYADFNDVKAKQTAVIEKLKTIKINGISRHEKLKSIHDYLANNIVYDSTLAESNIFDSYGALINGVCVCEGYAEAFKLICDREGIPCITVMGTGNGGAHKWNMVQMEDDEWYTLDVTWDDQTNYVYYSYFLIGSETKATFFNGSVADSTIHIPSGKMFSIASNALSYPTLSTDTYGVGMIRYGAKDVHIDTSRGVIMVGKDVTNYINYFVQNTTSGFTRKRNGTGVTTSTLTISDGITSVTYLVAMRGDVDVSNKTDTNDYLVMTQICDTTYKVENNTAQFYAGDMNQDGAIDGFDAIALELYTNGSLTFE